MEQPRHLGRYEILSTLGYGSMGVVYLAYDPVIDRKVALKTLRDDHDERFGVEMRQRFLREARAAGKLSHPNIVTVFDAVEDQEQQTAFIAMEYLQGTNLRDAMCSGVHFDAHRAAEIGAVVADALHYAHAEGVIHRDVKPANIIIADQGAVWIADFGIARLEASELTVEGAVLGSPFYMSPEQIRGQQVDGRSDIYSLGVILFEILTGQRPFTAGSLPELSITIVKKAALDPATLSPGIPRGLSEIILRCLSKDPEARFQNGEDLARALRETDLGTPQPVPPALDREPSSDQYRTPPLPLSDRETVFELPPECAITEVTSRADFEPPATVRRGWRSRRSWIAVAAVASVLSGVIAVIVFTGGPEPDRVAETGAPVQAGTASATLEIICNNRLRVAQIEVRMDGIPLWSSQLPPPESLTETLAGRKMVRALPVPEGVHSIAVHISDRLSKIEADGSIEGEFRTDRPRQLEVNLDPGSQKLGLAWLQ